ncbi:MAG: hypothetical protein IT353_19170 [Gemmatimonadaceae bacterium]|nr:hypothetical protein [Gemmatimonadaceae bacterium]
MTPNERLAPAAPQPTPPNHDDDRIAPPVAARLTALGYPDAFNAARWRLEEAFDPASGAVIPFPPAMRVAHRRSAQLAALPTAERDEYQRAKRARMEWTNRHWMRVPAWGGRCSPGGEYRYSARRCRAWFERSIGGGDAR